MDNRDEIKDFLRTRRARLTPEDAGLTAFASNRRVPGLKRGEVADLAGVSVEYYAQLERGNLAGVSDSVLDSLGRALQLDEAERTHLADLARAAGPATRQRRKPAPGQIRPGVQRLLDLIGDDRPGHREQRPPRPGRRQHPRPLPVLTGVRHTPPGRQPRQPRPVHLP